MKIDGIEQGNREMTAASMNQQYPQRLSDFWVLVSEQPFASDLLSPTLDDPNVHSYFVAGQAGRPSDVQVGQWGRYVRVQLSDAEYLNIAEVGVCGYAATPTPTDTRSARLRAQTPTITNTPVVSATPTRARLRAKTPTATVPAAATPTAQSTPTPPALEHAQYVYDGDNNLVKSVINGVETYYIGQYYEKVVEGETTTVRKYYFAGSTRIAMREDGTLYWLLSDHLGSTSVTTTQNGEVFSELRYSAFGEIRYAINSTPTDYLYTGQRVDSYINLYWYNSRWYDHELSHFVQADSIVPEAGDSTAWNRYAYTGYSPITYSDPSGHYRLSEGTGTKTKFDYLYKCRYEFGWDFEELHDYSDNQLNLFEDIGRFSKKQSEQIWRAGRKILNYVHSLDKSLDGDEWIRDNLGGTMFHKGGLPQEVVSLGPFENSVVFLNHHIWLIPDSNYSGQHIVHELVHVLDSNTKSFALWTGGGAADDLFRHIGGEPRGIRWTNSNIREPEGYKWNSQVNLGYGNQSTADYFAEAFSWSIYKPSNIPGPSGEIKGWIDTLIVDLAK